MIFTMGAFILVGCLGAMGLFEIRFTAWIVAALLIGIGVIIDASGKALMPTRGGRKQSQSRR
jgi:hypothetical protein